MNCNDLDIFLHVESGDDFRTTYATWRQGLSIDRRGITFKGKNLLWLPAHARPSCSAVSGSTMEIGNGSGRVLMFRLCEAGPIGFRFFCLRIAFGLHFTSSTMLHKRILARGQVSLYKRVNYARL